MISVAVSGYGLVIWESDDEWRVYAPSDSASATLAARVEMALDTVPAGSQDSVRDALLSISGAWLLAADCDHGPGGCDTDHELN